MILLSLMAGIISVTAFIFLRIQVGGLKALSVKVIAGMSYILVGVFAYIEMDLPQLGIMIILGQIFGLLGDIFLDQKYIHPENSLGYTHLGFSVFGIGHVIYIVGIVRNYAINGFILILAIVGTLLIVAFVYFTEKPFKLNYGSLRIDVVLYSFILGFMTVLPLIMILINGMITTLLIIFIAMVAFLISDLILSQIYFAKDQNKPLLIVANYIFYYFAQFGIALSILFIK